MRANLELESWEMKDSYPRIDLESDLEPVLTMELDRNSCYCWKIGILGSQATKLKSIEDSPINAHNQYQCCRMYCGLGHVIQRYLRGRVNIKKIADVVSATQIYQNQHNNELKRK